MATKLFTIKPIEREKSFDYSTRIKSSKSTLFTSSLKNLTYPSTQSFIRADASLNRKQIEYLSELKQHYYQIDSNESEKPIFVSYESNANFQEKKFVCDLVRQLKENCLYEDIWFDKDEFKLDKPYWSTSRLEACERSNAALLIVTSNYFENQLSVYESKIVFDLKKHEQSAYYLAVIIVYFKGYSGYHTSTHANEVEEAKTKKFLQNFSLLKPLIERADLFINFTDTNLTKLSLNEKVSYCVGCLTKNLENFAKFKRNAPPQTPFNDEPHSTQDNFESASQTRLTNRPFGQLIVFKQHDLQCWLNEIGVSEYHRSNFAELQVDGFLLCACSDNDFLHIFDVDSKITRKYLRSAVSEKLECDLHLQENWHLKLKYIKPTKMNSVYVIFDPIDANLITTLLQELKNNYQDVCHHQGFGKSKQEFLSNNAHAMANCKHIFVYLTENSARSQFVLFECIFCLLILNRTKIITILAHKDLWSKMKFGLRALLGDHLSIDFTQKLNIKCLLQYIKPKLNSYESLVVMEKVSLDEQLFKPLHLLANTSMHTSNMNFERIRVYMSQVADHWETHKRLEKLMNSLETYNIKCWSENFNVESKKVDSNRTAKSHLNLFDSVSSNNMERAQVLMCCITLKYLTSETCIKDIHLADSLKIPIIPVMLKGGITWPPDGIQYHTRKIFSSLKCIDVTSDLMLKRNLTQIISTIHTIFASKNNRVSVVVNQTKINSFKYLSKK